MCTLSSSEKIEKNMFESNSCQALSLTVVGGDFHPMRRPFSIPCSGDIENLLARRCSEKSFEIHQICNA